ncbi:MAG: hypothetical protein ACJ76H_00970 [Bacteriovoracaceae bacterium]
MFLRSPFLILPLLLCASLAWASPGAQTVNLKKDWQETSLTNDFVYSSWKNNSPPFGTNQTHQGLADLMSSSGASELCFPSSLTTAMVKQFAFQNRPVRNLKLAGLSPDQWTIDLNDSVRDFVVRCKTDPESGTYMNDGANCLHDFYKESGVEHFEIKLIRTFNSNIETPEVSNVRKKIEISDIIDAIDNGYDVIGYVKWARPDTNDRSWKGYAGHFVNIFGYARKIPWKDMIWLEVSNPMRVYDNESHIQVFDPVFAEVIPADQTLNIPSSIGNIVLEGTGFNGNKNRGFLSGLLIFKAE